MRLGFLLCLLFLGILHGRGGNGGLFEPQNTGKQTLPTPHEEAKRKHNEAKVKYNEAQAKHAGTKAKRKGAELKAIRERDIALAKKEEEEAFAEEERETRGPQDIFHPNGEPHLAPFEDHELQEKWYQQRESSLLEQYLEATQRQDTYHPSTCLGTQSVKIPRGCNRENVTIMSFPKSGRTWLRCVVASMSIAAKNKNPTNFSIEQLDNRLSGNKFSHGKPHPYHHSPETISNILEDDFLPTKPVIYLGRDPRDVAVSNYHEVTNRRAWKFFGMEGSRVQNMTLSEFLRFEKGSFLTNVAMMNTWAKYRGGKCPRLIVYYENLLAGNCWLNEYHKIAEFLQLWLSKRQLYDIRDRCSFDHLKEEIGYTSPGLLNRRWTLEKKDDPQSAKVRRGVVGGYREEASYEDVNWMEEHAYFVGEFMEYDARYRGTVKLSPAEVKEGVKDWRK